MIRTILIPIFMLGVCSAVLAGEDYDLWKEAKRYWYDEEWQKAADSYETLLTNYPNSPFHFKSMYFLAYCEVKMDRDDRAFELLTELVEGKNDDRKDGNLIEDAKSLRILIAFEKSKNDGSFKTVLKDALKDKSTSIRFQSASSLAELGDRACVNVLFQILETTKDADMRDLAIKKLLLVADEKDKKRLDSVLQEKRTEGGEGAPRMLRLIVRDLTGNKETVKVNVPEKLLSIVLRSLTPEQRDLIEQNAVDLDALSREIRNMPPNTVIFQISDKNQEIKLYLD
ncbi:MAG: tetratricopeptide repeat protein [Acidobacteria bacterium]|nr:tetratricopeptide repeat protein [Acidobacteriota bacterium]